MGPLKLYIPKFPARKRSRMVLLLLTAFLILALAVSLGIRIEEPSSSILKERPPLQILSLEAK